MAMRQRAHAPLSGQRRHPLRRQRTRRGQLPSGADDRNAQLGPPQARATGAPQCAPLHQHARANVPSDAFQQQPALQPQASRSNEQTCSQAVTTSTSPQPPSATQSAATIPAPGAVCPPAPPPVLTDMRPRCTSARTRRHARARGQWGQPRCCQCLPPRRSHPPHMPAMRTTGHAWHQKPSLMPGQDPCPAGHSTGGPKGAPARRRTPTQRGQSHMPSSLHDPAGRAPVRPGPVGGNSLRQGSAQHHNAQGNSLAGRARLSKAAAHGLAVSGSDLLHDGPRATPAQPNAHRCAERRRAPPKPLQGGWPTDYRQRRARPHGHRDRDTGQIVGATMGPTGRRARTRRSATTAWPHPPLRATACTKRKGATAAHAPASSRQVRASSAL